MHSPTIALGVPYKDSTSQKNEQIVRDAVAKRFPDWAGECEPYVNVLTLKAWNQRGYRVRKGEKAIRVFTQVPITRHDEKTGKDQVVGLRPSKAYVFALPQVEKREVFPQPNTHDRPSAPASAAAAGSPTGTPETPLSQTSTSGTSGTTSASSMP
jgi:hypothetical protein